MKIAVLAEKRQKLNWITTLRIKNPLMLISESLIRLGKQELSYLLKKKPIILTL
jgi:hypothetical protein